MKRRGILKPYPPEDLGQGWHLWRLNMGTWTRYTIMKLDAAGMVINQQCESFCRKRDALAYRDKHETSSNTRNEQ